MSHKRFKIKGVRREALDYDALCYVVWRMAKLQVEERRRREAEEKAKRREGRS